MADGIYLALSGALAQGALLENTANNLANATTDGFQRSRAVFRERVSPGGGPAAAHFSVLDTTALDGSAGARRNTGRGLDAALPEGTYLAVQTPRGERYTRAVSLAVAPDGALRTSRGEAVLGEDGRPLTPGVGELTLGPDGALLRGGAPVGRLRLVRFPRPEALSPEGGALLAASGRSGPAAAAPAVLEVGALEESNAPVVSAMTDLVTASRNFEAFQRVIEAFREADRRVVTTVPGTNG
ncbi:MAG: flagellar hook basal-body protein [Deltaproteobacteria bacterium]|nr:flagellar hook basal-body protein [Deltaproteobacteria bacterium]